MSLLSPLKGSVTLAIILLLSVIALAGCSNPIFGSSKPKPETTVQQFLTSVQKGNGTAAIGCMCESGVAVDLEKYIQQLPVGLTYKMKTEENDDQFATVRITGQVQFKIGPLTAKKMIDGRLKLTNIGETWCIQRDSINSFLGEAWNTK